MKQCWKCKKDKPKNEFHKNSARPDGLQSSCKICKKEYDNEYYKENTTRYKIYNIEYRRRIKNLIKISKNKCIDCPEIHRSVLEFHHRDPSMKKFTINHAYRLGYNIQKIQKEIDKCDVLCSNCHKKRHWAGNLGGELSS